MGKKSLFATTTEPDQKPDEAPGKKTDRQPDPEPEQAVEQAAPETAEPEPAAVAPAEAAPAEPEPAPAPEEETASPETVQPRPPQPAVSYQNVSPATPAACSQDIPGGSVFKSPLAIALACFVILLLMIAVSSKTNSGHYFIKEKDGAVEIWQGDFTPTGKNRIMILHGQEWPGAAKDFYTQQEAFGFARNVYLEKAGALLNDAGPVDDERITAYLKQALALLPEKLLKKNHDKLSTIDQYINEAAVLNNSEEKVAVDLAQKKLAQARDTIAALSALASPPPQTETDQPEESAAHTGVNAQTE